MGFKVPKRTIPLNFKGTELEGLEVNIKPLPLGEYLEFQKGFRRLVESSNEVTEEDEQFFIDTINCFAQVIDSWDLEDENGTPVPATRDGIMSLDSVFVIALLDAFMAAIEGVDEDLGKDSTSGPNLEGLDSIPMEPLSPSPVT